MVNVDRFWDPENQYPNAVLAVYPHWVVEVSYRQHTLGSFIVFARREVTHLSQLHDQEMLELRDVLVRTETTLRSSQVFHPDWINYWQMGNGLHHLHLHGIPRYREPRSFAGRMWVDTTWGHPPVWSTIQIETSIIEAIVEEFQTVKK